jgi:predicted ribosome quality control (RQC) complex YloA/Tae2 family protein
MPGGEPGVTPPSSPPGRSGGEPRLRARVELDGCEILVGRDARDNDALTFRVGRPTDLWLHAAGHAGSHVLVRPGSAPRHVVERAARLAAYHSKARAARGKVAVHVCRIADVRKARGAPPGEVELRRFDVLKVYPGDVA